MTYQTSRGRVHPLAYWLTMILGALVTLLGLVILAGGAWLLALGGSFYYLIAGIGLLVSGILMLRGKLAGVFAYLLTYIFTLIWALWEVGFDGWAQVPRLVAPTVILILVLLTIPVLRRLDNGSTGRMGGRGALAASIAVLGLGLGVLATPLFKPAPVSAQVPSEDPNPLPATPSAPEAPEEAPTGTQAPAQPAAPQGEPAAPVAPAGEAPAQDAPAASAPGAPAAPAAAPAEPSVRPAEPIAEVGENWPVYGGDIHATRYSPLDQITRENVGQLEKVWEYRTGDLPLEGENDYAAETTPLKIGDDIYMCSALNILISVDAGSGREEWRYDPQVSRDAIPYSASCRGVAYYVDPDAAEGDLCATRIIMGTLDARLIAVDSKLGQPCTDFGQNGEVNLETGIGETVPGWYAVTSPPAIVRGIVVTGAQVKDGQAEDAPSGVIRGYDAVTGELAWAWDMGNPAITGLPPEGEVYTRGTPNMWTSASADEELGYVYLPLGNSSVDYWGGNRSDQENQFSTSLVAIDVSTGKPVWHFQTVHYDVWDYDLGSQATLVDFPTDSGTVPAIILPSKQGDLYVLDRRTGEPLVPFEEREVPTGGVEPENLSPTQPFSLYHTLAKRELNEKDMWGMSPLDQLWCRIQFRQAEYQGMYTPPTSDKYYIEYPGYNGGSDWGSIAVDTDRGIIIANYNDMPNHNRLIPREEADAAGLRAINAPGGAQSPMGEAGPQVGSPYAISVNAGWRVPFTGLMCKQPPYGGITAIDLASGDTLWDRPFGTARANGPFGVPSMLPAIIGTPNNGGPAVTAGGLIFIAAATDNLIRAIDIETGETVWQDVLPAGGQANPFVFEVDGREMIGIMAGGHHFMETPIGDYLIAYALPEQAG